MLLSTLLSLSSLAISLFSLLLSFDARREKSGRALKAGRKQSREEREAAKEERLYREGIENILGYWPIRKEGGQTEDGKL